MESYDSKVCSNIGICHPSVDYVDCSQGKMMEEDTGSCSKGRKAQVHTSQVIDSLGKITHVFSDKTGTLTQNIMESWTSTGMAWNMFRYVQICSVVLVSDSPEAFESIRKPHQLRNISRLYPSFFENFD